MFDRSNSKNKYSKFTIVHISYCSGDMFGGNTTRPYTDSQGQPVVQVGLFNAQSTVDWINSQMKNGGLSSTLSQLVVAGCSAGSIGAQLWANSVLKQLKWKNAAVLPDSYAGVFPDGSEGPLIYDFGYCTSGFLSDDLYKKCMNKELTLVDINMDNLASIKNVPYTFIQSKTDIVQQSFYIAVATTTHYQPYVLTPEQFYAGVNEIFGTYNGINQNFVTYLVDGDHHCFTNQDLYYKATTKGPYDNGKATNTEGMTKWVNYLPLAENESINTRCDDGGNSKTSCSSNVSPKSYTEHY
jgi:hypothetical protein